MSGVSKSLKRRPNESDEATLRGGFVRSFEIRLLMIFVEVALYSFFFFVSFPSELWNRWLNCAGALALEMHMLSSHDKLAIGYLIFDL